MMVSCGEDFKANGARRVRRSPRAGHGLFDGLCAGSGRATPGAGGA